MADNTGGPAFPVDYDDSTGMTLRDYFAAKALAGMISSAPIVDRTKVDKRAWAAAAYEFARAMLAERERSAQ